MTTLWYVGSDPSSPPIVSLATPLTYADRLRIRQPGDASFALGPHQDGGSVERWEEGGYGRGGVYEAVFRGAWDGGDHADGDGGGRGGYDPFDAAGRAHASRICMGDSAPAACFACFRAGWP